MPYGHLHQTFEPLCNTTQELYPEEVENDTQKQRVRQKMHFQ